MINSFNTIKWMNFQIPVTYFSNAFIPQNNTKRLEKDGAIIFEGNLEKERLETFIRDVCTWGNYAGIATRVLKDNNIIAIQQAFKKAIYELKKPEPNLALALFEINQIKGLGRPSFASKHLRFLYPQICPVFDSIIFRNSSYTYDEIGYSDFAQDCINIASQLETENIPNPRQRPNNKWYAVDVETALYKYVKPSPKQPSC